MLHLKRLWPTLLAAVLIVTGCASSSPDRAAAQPTRAAAAAATPAHPGSWQIVADCTVGGYKVNPIHSAMTPGGKVLMVAGSGYNRYKFDQQKADQSKQIFKAWLWDPAKPGTCPKEIPLPRDKDLFCAGHAMLPDGRLLFFGGTAKYGVVGSQLGDRGYYEGIREAWTFDEATERFTPVAAMEAARWYPNGVVDTDGNLIVVGGLDENAAFTPINEKFDPKTNTWSTLPGRLAFPLYADLRLLPSGKFAYTGVYFGVDGHRGVMPMTWDPKTNAYQGIPGAGAIDCRNQGLALFHYPKITVTTGGCDLKIGTTSATYVLDVSKSSLAFEKGPATYPTMHACGAVLPDRSLFVAGGGGHNVNPRLRAMRLANGATKWQELAKPQVARMYHSTCLPLPDGTVVTLGTNYNDGKVETRFEVYKPWYAQPGVVRPVITSTGAAARAAKSGCAPNSIGYGETTTLSYSGPAVNKAVLTRLPSVTHSSDPNARTVGLNVTAAGSGKVSLTMTTNRGIIPPGVYMLSLLGTNGVPSAAKVIQVGPSVNAAAGEGCCC